MATIVPAILEKEKDVFLARCEEIEKLPGVTRVQVDFCDGEFVENTALSIEEMDVLNPTFEWEAHLMVKEPVDFFDYQMVGFGVVIVHLESFENLDQIQESLKKIRELGMKTGLAINPETDVEEVLPYVELVDQFTLLSIHPGAQGREFLLESIARIEKLRKLLPNAIIEVDGGLNQANIGKVADSGANLVVVGSALKAGSPERIWDGLI